MKPTADPQVPKILPPHLFYASIILMHLLGRFETGTSFAGFWGLPLVAFGVWCALREKRRFIARDTTFYPGKDASRLVTDGAYRYTRNPMYLGMVLILLGLWPLTGGWLPLVPLVAFMAAIQHFFIRREETSLERLFGDDYLTYKARVRRWL